MDIDTLLARYPIISDQVEHRELRGILNELKTCLESDGDGSVVELGCYSGTTSLFIRRLMNAYGYMGEFHVYDSFEGLPEKTSYDSSVAGDQFRAGELAVSKKEFVRNFKKAGLTLPTIHKSWFADLTAADIPNDIIFAFLDGDYYESIRDSFALITPKLAHSAVVIVDDYANEALPGAARATDEWLAVHPGILRVAHSLAFIKIQ